MAEISATPSSASWSRLGAATAQNPTTAPSSTATYTPGLSSAVRAARPIPRGAFLGCQALPPHPLPLRDREAVEHLIGHEPPIRDLPRPDVDGGYRSRVLGNSTPDLDRHPRRLARARAAGSQLPLDATGSAASRRGATLLSGALLQRLGQLRPSGDAEL